jgi:hypothetical protein
MGAHLRAFFKNADAGIKLLFQGQLFKTYGRGQAGRAGADDNHVIVHLFTLHDQSRPPLPVQGRDQLRHDRE